MAASSGVSRRTMLIVLMPMCLAYCATWRPTTLPAPACSRYLPCNAKEGPVGFQSNPVTMDAELVGIHLSAGDSILT